MGIVDYFGSEIFHTQNWVKKESNLIAQNLHLDKRVDRKKQDVMRLKPCKSSVIYWLCASIADVQSPSFGVTCPASSFLAYTELGRFSAQVNWTEPVATDNSGVPPAVTSNYQPPQRLSEGIHVIMYTAVDQSGNTATCDFTVKVVGKRILACIVKFIYSYLFGFSLKL